MPVPSPDQINLLAALKTHGHAIDGYQQNMKWFKELRARPGSWDSKLDLQDIHHPLVAMAATLSLSHGWTLSQSMDYLEYQWLPSQLPGLQQTKDQLGRGLKQMYYRGQEDLAKAVAWP